MSARIRKQTFLAIVAASFLSACAAETIVHDIDEREANRIIELLDTKRIKAKKLIRDTGREILYSISVPAKHQMKAIKALNDNELPRRTVRGYSEVFGESGLIPTAAEERAKHLSALEGEIERQLRLIDGILDVQVQIVLPEESALRTTEEQKAPTTASVTIKYLQGEGGSKPVSNPEVEKLVAAGVEGLTPDNVEVLMRPAGTAVVTRVASARTSSVKELLANKNVQLGIGIAAVLIVIFAGLTIVTQLRLRSVRSRLIRLQNEIAKARRKPGEGSIA